MNLVYIANIRIPTEKAHGIQIMKTCEAFAAVGNTVTLLVPKRINVIKDDPFAYYHVKKNFNIVRIPTIDLTYLGKFGTFLSTIIFTECSVWYIRTKTPRDRIVYSRDVWPLFNTRFLGWNLFWEAHAAKKTWIASHLLRVIKGLVVISNGLKNFYSALGIEDKNITVAPDAVDVAQFAIEETKEECRTRIGIPKDKKIVMYSGHLYKRKGVDVLVGAARSLPPEYLVVLVGGTKADIERIEKKVEGLQNIMIVGYKNHREIPYYLKAADMLVIPNLATDDDSNLYTSPMKLFEYMASGTQIVSSDVPALKEILGDTGARYFIAGDSEDLSKAIMSPQVSARSSSVYSWDNRAKEIIGFIQSHV